MIHAFVAICLFGGALAQRSAWNCSNFDYMENLNYTRFMGKWYSAEANQPLNRTDCGSMNLVIENGVNIIFYEHRDRLRIEGTDNYELSPEISRDNETLDNDELVAWFFELIIETDYTSYGVMTVCDSGNVVIITRDQYPTTQVLTKAREIIRKKIGNVEIFPRNVLGCGPTTSSSNSTDKTKSSSTSGDTRVSAR